MNYSARTLNSEWHAAREAEPKDFDIVKSFTNKTEKNKLHSATYKRIGTDSFRLPLRTTSQDANMSRIELTDKWRVRNSRKSMVNVDSLSKINLAEPNKGKPDFALTLRRHNEDNNRQRFSTTQGTDYRNPYPYDTRSKKGSDLECNQTEEEVRNMVRNFKKAQRFNV